MKVYIVYRFLMDEPVYDPIIEVHRSEKDAQQVVEALNEFVSLTGGDESKLPERLQGEDLDFFDGFEYSEHEFIEGFK